MKGIWNEHFAIKKICSLYDFSVDCLQINFLLQSTNSATVYSGAKIKTGLANRLSANRAVHRSITHIRVVPDHFLFVVFKVC